MATAASPRCKPAPIPTPRPAASRLRQGRNSTRRARPAASGT